MRYIPVVMLYDSEACPCALSARWQAVTLVQPRISVYAYSILNGNVLNLSLSLQHARPNDILTVQ